VLALLSNPSTQLLAIKFRSQDGQGPEIAPAEITQKLTAWWRHKSISEDDWRNWAALFRSSGCRQTMKRRLHDDRRE
jgi:hypothetical protein